jgi:DNA-binding response OmpR family regulator
MKRVLVIEDDESLAVGLTHALGTEGYEVQVARDGPEGLHQAVEGHPDLVLLDLMLPGMSGYEICKRMRDLSIRCPVIILTSRSEENDRVLGLELGADDYVTKPFSLRELLARVRAHLRRTEPAPPGAQGSPSRVRIGEVLVDLDRHEVHREGRLQTLTRREFGLLTYLIHHPGEVLSRERLLKEAWGYAANQTTRTVDNHVLRLRKHIEPDPDRPRYIRTARGEGYLFDPEPAHHDDEEA